MEFPKVGYYDDRNKARVPIDRGAIKAAFGQRKKRLRVEVMEGYIVLTSPDGPKYTELDT